MPNKLSEIFSDDMFNINGKMRFKDEKAYKNFISALQIVQKEGRVVPIEGITSIVTEIQTQGQKYPLQEYTNISEFVVGPSIEKVTINFDDTSDKKIIQFSKYAIEEGIVLETAEKSIIYFKLIFHKEVSLKLTLTYKMQFEIANSIQEIIDAIDSALALMNRLYDDSNLKASGEDGVLLSETKKRFKIYFDYFSRIVAIEKILGLVFEPKYLKDISYENQKDIEELYLLLCEKAIIRTNSKVNSSKIALASREKDRDLMVGLEIALCLLGTIEYQLFGYSITLHSASLLTNAVVKEIKESEDGIQVYYGDTDAKPMYISFSAFMNEEDAQKEMDIIMEHKELYINAKTIQEHIDSYN